MKRNPALIKQAKERDSGRCQRCLTTNDLHGHHKHALADGGPDTLDNIITLCRRCHKEWHHHCEDALSFDDFKESVPGYMLYRLMADEAHDHLTLGDVREIWLRSVLARLE